MISVLFCIDRVRKFSELVLSTARDPLIAVEPLK
jgi:hypothetical protein